MHPIPFARRALARPIHLPVLAALLIGCASAPSGSAPAAAEIPEQGPLGRMLGDAVMVLPVHETSFEGVAAVASQDSINALRNRFDAHLRRLLAPHATGTWTWPEELRALHRRNPLNVPDPMRLATRGLRGTRLKAEEQLSAELGSDIRALLAIAGARRYVMLPLHLHVGPGSHGGYAGGVSVVVIDARRATILQVRPVAVGTAARDQQPAAAEPIPLEAALAHLAELVRLEFTGPDDR